MITNVATSQNEKKKKKKKILVRIEHFLSEIWQLKCPTQEGGWILIPVLDLNGAVWILSTWMTMSSDGVFLRLYFSSTVINSLMRLLPPFPLEFLQEGEGGGDLYIPLGFPQEGEGTSEVICISLWGSRKKRRYQWRWFVYPSGVPAKGNSGGDLYRSIDLRYVTVVLFTPVCHA